MSHSLVNGNVLVANVVYLIIIVASYGPNTLNREHAHVEYTLLAGTIAKYHEY